jgi:hypothetical protein
MRLQRDSLSIAEAERIAISVRFCTGLAWAQAAIDTGVKSNAAFANFIVISPSFSSADLGDPGAPLLKHPVNRTLAWARIGGHLDAKLNSFRPDNEHYR